MVFKGKISPEIRALAVCLREKQGESYPEIAKRCKISVSSAERICKTPLSLYSNDKTVKRHSGKKMGRPRKVSDRCKRLLHRNLVNLRAYNPNVTVKWCYGAKSTCVEKKRGRTDHHRKGLERPSRRKAAARDICHSVQQGGYSLQGIL